MIQRKPYVFRNETSTKIVKIIASKQAEAMERGSKKKL